MDTHCVYYGRTLARELKHVHGRGNGESQLMIEERGHIVVYRKYQQMNCSRKGHVFCSIPIEGTFYMQCTNIPLPQTHVFTVTPRCHGRETQARKLREDNGRTRWRTSLLWEQLL